MGDINSSLEGALLIAGEISGPVFIPSETREITVKASFAEVFHSGPMVTIATDTTRLGEELCSDKLFEPCGKILVVTGGSEADIRDAGCQSKIITLGEQSRVSYDIDDDNISEDYKVMRENLVFMAGNGAQVDAGEFDYIDSVVMCAASANVYLNGRLDGDYSNNKVVTVGENSSITVMNDSVAANLGTDSTVNVGKNSVILSSESSMTFVLDVGSCAAIAWHDGTRKRIKVVYEGENGIVAGNYYKIDQNGNVV